METAIKEFLSIWNSIPALFLEFSASALLYVEKVLLAVYNDQPNFVKEKLEILKCHVDVLMLLGLLGMLVLVLGNRIRKASITDVFLTLFCLAIFSAMLFGSFYYIVLNQFMIWHSNHLNSSEKFYALMPLDFNADISLSSIEVFFEGSGRKGRQFYMLYLLIDTVCLICLTILNRQLFSLTFGISLDTTHGFPLKWAAQKLPLILATMDLYENISLSWICFHWTSFNRDYSDEFLSFVSRLAFIIRGKLALSCLLIGMQISLFFVRRLNEKKKLVTATKKALKKH